jgi:pSer/pThr/pTyr-binding forkhead associated (FHA) protein
MLAQPRLYRIGSAPNNNIIVRHDSVSETHAEIFVDQYGNAFLTDLHSGKPTMVNGESVYQPVHLSPGEKITVGRGILIDWEKMIFNRKQPVSQLAAPLPVQEPKPLADVPIKRPSKAIKQTVSTATQQVGFIAKNLDLILIYGGILLMWLIITLQTG